MARWASAILTGRSNGCTGPLCGHTSILPLPAIVPGTILDLEVRCPDDECVDRNNGAARSHKPMLPGLHLLLAVEPVHWESVGDLPHGSA
jgi:hypothetical protein